MTENNRIVLNTIATYARSVIGVLCGIFTTRWVLQSLGQIDFGLYSVIGGMVIFLSFLNIQFAGAISRYYAYSIGQARLSQSYSLALHECQAWFTTAVLIHTVIPILLLFIGGAIGSYALAAGWVHVPAEKVGICIKVWWVVSISTFVGMLSVPFQAMYTAKQYIAELTVYSLFQTLERMAFVYYMVCTPGEWLFPYAVGCAAIAVFPQALICIRACIIFKECRIIFSAMKEFNRVKQVACYAAWTAVGGVGYVACHQCMGILLNNAFGAKVAGGFGVAQSVSGEAAALTGALQGAFQPAITTAYGAADIAKMKRMAFQICKIGTMLTFIFAAPLALEIKEILSFWLRTPPPYAEQMCICALSFIVLEKLSSGHLAAVNATGKIALFQIVRGILRTLVIPLAVIFIYYGFTPSYVCLALPLSVVFVVIGDVYLAHRMVGMDAVFWLKTIAFPFILLTIIVFVFGLLPRIFISASLFRVVITTIVTIIGSILVYWPLLLNREERELVNMVVKRWLNKFTCWR